MTRRRRRSDQGSGTAEAAVVLPAAYLLILTLIQVAVWWYAAHAAHAVADVALAAARADGGTPEQAQAEAAGLATQLGGRLLTNPTIRVERTTTTATVRVHATAATLIPGLDLPVTVELTGPTERFTHPTGGG